MVFFWIDSWDWGCSPLFSSVDSSWWWLGKRGWPLLCGMLQDSVLSLFLFNSWMSSSLAKWIYLWPWWIKWCDEHLILVSVRVWMRNNRLQHNLGKTEWLWVLGITGSRTMPSLVLDRIALPQTDLVHNLGVLLDFQILLEKKVVVMARRTFAQLCVVLCLPISRSGAFAHSHSWHSHP